MTAMSYLDLLGDDLITKIFEYLTKAIEKDIDRVESTLDDIDDRVCGNDINDTWIIGLDIGKKNNPRKIKIIVDNKKYEIPYDLYYITYGRIKYNIADPHLNSNAHLFSRYPLDNIIIIAKHQTGADIIDEETGEFECVILKSPVIKSPLYVDILRETNKLYLELCSICEYFGDDNCLSETYHIKNKKKCYKYYNISYEDFAKYNYITTNLIQW